MSSVGVDIYYLICIRSYLQFYINYSNIMDDNNNKALESMFMLWALNRWIQENAAKDLYEEWYSPEEISDELDMDEDDVREIVDDFDD